MQAFADAYGNWRFLLSQVLAEDNRLMSDLMEWRYLENTARRAQEQEKEDDA